MDEPHFPTFFPTILLVTTVGFFVADLYVPSMPAIVEGLQTSDTLVQLTLSLYLVAMGCVQLIYGPLSDRFGRRKVVLGGLAFSLIGTSVCLVAQHIAYLIIGRLLQGLTLGVGACVGRAVVRDAYSGERLAQVGSYIPIGTALILGSAPIMGGYIQSFGGWKMNFLAIFLYTLILLNMVVYWMPETNRYLNPSALKWRCFWGSYWKLIKDPSFVGYSLCSSLIFGGLMVYLVISPFLFIQNLGFTSDQYGWFAVFIDGGIIVGGISNGLMIKRVGRHRLLPIGASIVTLSGCVMLLFALMGFLSMLVVMLPMVLYCIGGAMVFANSFAGALHPFEKMAGFAAALFGFVQIFGGSLVSIAMSGLTVRSQIPLAIALLLIGGSTLILQHIAFKESLKRKSHHKY